MGGIMGLDEATLRAMAGIAAGLLSGLAYLPYIRDTYLGRTTPHQSTWVIWSLLATLAFFAQVHEGAVASLWFAGVQAVGTVTVAVLSLRNGFGSHPNRWDDTVLVGAGIGLLIWYHTDNAIYALAISIVISALGGTVMVAKTRADPHSETLITWVLALIASVCAVAAVGFGDPVLLAYPMYLGALYATLVTTIVFGRLRVRSAALVHSTA
ncbi:MAG: hypothetical protein AAGF71_13190 [Pseudomonadota bacterium]